MMQDRLFGFPVRAGAPLQDLAADFDVPRTSPGQWPWAPRAEAARQSLVVHPTSLGVVAFLISWDRAGKPRAVEVRQADPRAVIGTVLLTLLAAGGTCESVPFARLHGPPGTGGALVLRDDRARDVVYLIGPPYGYEDPGGGWQQPKTGDGLPAGYQAARACTACWDDPGDRQVQAACYEGALEDVAAVPVALCTACCAEWRGGGVRFRAITQIADPAGGEPWDQPR